MAVDPKLVSNNPERYWCHNAVKNYARIVSNYGESDLRSMFRTYKNRNGQTEVYKRHLRRLIIQEAVRRGLISGEEAKLQCLAP